MSKQQKNIIVRLFNTGKLTLRDAEWLNNYGYSIICEDGRVIDIIKEEV